MKRSNPPAAVQPHVSAPAFTVPDHHSNRLALVGDLQAGRRPSIEAALDAAPSSEWAGLLHSLLIAEVNHRRSQGESPAAREYLPRFPAHTFVVRWVIPDTVPVAQPAPVAPTLPARPAPPIAGPIAVGLPVYASPPMAIVLSDGFDDIEPPPDVRPARIRRTRQRRRLLAGALFVMAIATAAIFLVRPYLRKTPQPGPATPAPKNAVTTAPKTISPFAPNHQTVDPERELAEWIVGVGGRGTLLMDAGGRRPFHPGTPLPKARFAVVAVVLPDESSGRWAATDLSRLKDRRKLASVELHHPTATQRSDARNVGRRR